MGTSVGEDATSGTDVVAMGGYCFRRNVLANRLEEDLVPLVAVKG